MAGLGPFRIGAEFPKAVAKITDDVEELLAFCDYRPSTGSTLRTTNPQVIWSPKGGPGCDLGCLVEDSVLDETA